MQYKDQEEPFFRKHKFSEKNDMVFTRSAGLLVIVLIMGLILNIPALYLVWNSNQANLFLLRWSILGDSDCDKGYLANAYKWGERARNYWTEVYREQTSVKLRQTCANKVPTTQGLADIYFKEGVEYEARENLHNALTSYQNACQSNEKHIQACFLVYRVLAEMSEPESGNSYLLRLKALKPDYLVGTVQEREMILLGFDLQIDLLGEVAENILVTLFWDIPAPIEIVSTWVKDDWTYIQIGSRLYQIGEVDNLLPNGGFERDISPIALLPFGYQNIRYNANQDFRILSTYHRLTMVEREGKISQVAVVMNPEEMLNGLTNKDKVKVSPGELYVLSGFMRVSEDAKVSLGGVFRTEKKEDISYWYINRNSNDQDWTSFGGVITAPQNAEIFDLLALNTGKGEVYFDNLLFSMIPYPDIE
jgi:tetratricopeptide (TPR) repeat protein